ncbi:hypothetical protein GW17_00055557 [Ensete ventricosum]|uniref:Uncharacterized protein n=1 Tax=Ensete ventricosum TaxID=4639 RepID=A0A444CAL2_ENSVE|nr:hypothetical protein GW17_00055557 [Ensete ventricosum]RZR75031.1 hypothetical protein BHM03_00048332 [Ensete ventricosum]
MVWTIPASAWTWLVRLRKASVVTMNDMRFEAGEGNPGLVIILQKRLGVCTAVVASSVSRGWCKSLYGGCRRSSVPGNLIALVAYPAIVRFHHARGPCGESAVRLLAYRHYLCQVGRTTVGDSALPVPGRQYDRWGFGLTYTRSVVRLLTPPYLHPTSFLHWVDHIDEPVIRRSDDMVSRSLYLPFLSRG